MDKLLITHFAPVVIQRFFQQKEMIRLCVLNCSRIYLFYNLQYTPLAVRPVTEASVHQQSLFVQACQQGSWKLCQQFNILRLNNMKKSLKLTINYLIMKVIMINQLYISQISGKKKCNLGIKKEYLKNSIRKVLNDKTPSVFELGMHGSQAIFTRLWSKFTVAINKSI